MVLIQDLGKNFLDKLNTIETETKEIWKKGELYHVYYTLHGIDHSHYVIDVLNKLIEGFNQEDKLTETEVFCLLAAAYLHDVGMLRKYPEDEEKAAKISESKKIPYTFHDVIRYEHHIRSGRYIKESSKSLKLDHVESECIRLISEGHRKTKLDSKEYDDQTIGLETVRVRLLSALLRLADELDITYKRAPETLFEILENNMPDYSRLQWLKHYYTSGVKIETSSVNGKKWTLIEINCRYPNEDIGRKMTEVLILAPIEKKLNEIRTILLEYGLILNLDNKIQIDKDLKEIPENLKETYLNQEFKISMELPRTKGFVGRNNELHDLLSSLDKNIIIIEGIAGIGKSYIAAKFAEESKDEYIVYWYSNLSEVSTLSSVMNKISIFLKENGKSKLFNYIENFGYLDNEVLITLLKEELNSGNFAIFFDDYHKAESELNPLLKQLIEIQSSKVIIITRKEPEFYNVVDERENRVVKIKVDAWDFVHTKMMLGARGIEATDETIENIHDVLHGHPQYLNLFCILAEKSTAEKLLKNLPTALKDAHEYLETEVYNSLSTEEKLLLQTIAVFRIAENIDAFDNVNKFNDINETLDNLIHKFLVNEIGINTFSVHDILRDYYLSDVSRKKILRSYHEKAAEYYLSLDNDPEYILEAAYHYDGAGIKEKSAEIILNNAGDFISKGFWKKIEDQLQSSIKHFQRKTQPHAIQFVAGANLEIAELYDQKGEYDLAVNHANKSLTSFLRIKDNLGIFKSNNILGSVHTHKGEYEIAKKYNDKCLKIAEKHQNDYWKAVVMGNIGNLLLNEDINKSLEYYLESLKVLENNDDNKNIAVTYNNLAKVSAQMGNYKKAYDYIKCALKLQKESSAIYNIANTKLMAAEIYYNDPKKPLNFESIIECAKEALVTYENIGHVRGVANVLDFVGNIYLDDKKDFNLAIDNYKKVSKIYSSLKQHSEESTFNSKIGLCYTNLKEWHNAKYYFEKNFDSGCFNIVDKTSLSEVYLITGSFNKAFEILNKPDSEESSDDRKYLVPLFLSITLLFLNKSDESNNYLKIVGETNYNEVNLNWDFSDINPVLNKMGDSKQLFTDAITLIKREINYPIIRLEGVKIISEDVRKQAELFYPFTGSVIITKDDEDLKQIMEKLTNSTEVDFDNLEILKIERNKALLVLGFLFKKGFLDCKNLDKQKFDLKLTERGLKILKLNEKSS